MDGRRVRLRELLASPRAYELWSATVGGRAARETLVAEYVRAEPGSRVLDLGCGPGSLYEYIKETEYVGVDLSPSYIERARRRFGGRAATFEVGDAEYLDPSLAGFDLATSFGVLHHLDDDGARRMLSNIARALRPNGRAVFVDGAYVASQSRLSRAVLRRDRGAHVRSPAEYTHLAESAFGDVKAHVRHDVLRIPYTHCIMECRDPRSPE